MKIIVHSMLTAFCIMSNMLNAAHIECLPTELAELIRSNALWPYQSLDDQGNTLLHYVASEGSVEDMIAIVNFYPFTTKNKQGKRPIDLINNQLQLCINQKERSRLIACASLLRKAIDQLDTQSVVFIVERAPDSLLFDPNDNVFARLLKRAVRCNNIDVYRALIRRFKAISGQPIEQYLSSNDLDDLNLAIERHKKNSKHFVMSQTSSDCVII